MTILKNGENEWVAYAIIIFDDLTLVGDRYQQAVDDDRYLQMRRSFSHSSMSCLMDANLRSAPGLEDPEDEAKKSDPCWQLTQQLHYRIEKVKEVTQTTAFPRSRCFKVHVCV